MDKALTGGDTPRIPKEDLVITRIFDAPREAVWKAWTDPEKLKLWWGPKGFIAPWIKIDFRVGGEYLFCVRSPEGKDCWSKGVYRQIVELERIVYMDSFADEKGNVVPAAHYRMSKELPLEMQVMVTFKEQGNKTKFTLWHAGFPPGHDLALATKGWNEALDKLAEILK